MAFYYVKSGGTAIGDGGRFASAQTGAWSGTAPEYYDEVADAFAATTTPAGGDVILVSDAHNKTGAAGTVTAPTGPVRVISVDDTNRQVYKAGATEDYTAGFASPDETTYIGMNFEHAGDVFPKNGTTWIDCTVEFVGPNDNILLNGSTRCGAFINCAITIARDSVFMEAALFITQNGGSLILKGCDISLGASVAGVTDFYSNIDGGWLLVEDCNFTGTWPTITYLNDIGTNDAQSQLRIKNTELPAYTNLLADVPTSPGFSIEVSNSATTSAAAEYQFTRATSSGQVDDETSIYRDGSTAFPSGQKISLKAVTRSDCNDSLPFRFQLPSRFVELSAAASDNVTFYFLCANTLNDGDIYAEINYPDGTNKQVRNRARSVAAGMFAPDYRTPGPLSTNTEAWTGRTTENRYEITLDTSGDVGADCVPEITIYIAKPSETIYICPTVGLS